MIQIKNKNKKVVFKDKLFKANEEIIPPFKLFATGNFQDSRAFFNFIGKLCKLNKIEYSLYQFGDGAKLKIDDKFEILLHHIFMQTKVKRELDKNE